MPEFKIPGLPVGFFGIPDDCQQDNAKLPLAKRIRALLRTFLTGLGTIFLLSSIIGLLSAIGAAMTATGIAIAAAVFSVAGSVSDTIGALIPFAGLTVGAITTFAVVMFLIFFSEREG